MSVVVLRLLNGDEVIGNQTSKSDNTVTLRKGVGIRVFENNGQGQLGFFDYLPLGADQDLNFDRSHIVLQYTPNEQVLNLYNQHFGSGLVMAKSMPNLPPMK